MTFTDDDFETIKRQHQHTSSEYAANCKSCALIARLEAAEKAMNHFSTETVLNDCCHPYLTAWRKAAGK